MEAKQAELTGKQARLDTAAVEATRLQGRFEEQGRQLTQHSAQAESLQISLDQAAIVHKKVSQVQCFVCDAAYLHCIYGFFIMNVATGMTAVLGWG